MLHLYKILLSFSLLTGVFFPCVGAMAFTASMQASAGFVAPVKLAVVTDPQFSAVAGSQPGRISVSGAEDQVISINTGNYRASGGVTPSDATCKYGTAPAVPCGDRSLGAASSPGMETPLLIAVRITPLSELAETTETPGFDLTVIYN